MFAHKHTFQNSYVKRNAYKIRGFLNLEVLTKILWWFRYILVEGQKMNRAMTIEKEKKMVYQNLLSLFSVVAGFFLCFALPPFGILLVGWWVIDLINKRNKSKNEYYIWVDKRNL